MAWYNSWSDFKDGVSSIPGAGLVSGVLGTGKDALVAPNSYDANGNLADSKAKAGQVFDTGMSRMALAGMSGAPVADIKAQQLATPDTITAQTVNAPAAVTARDVATSGLVAGPQADAIRQQTLDQAATAAASPSSAAAQMRAAGSQISQQQLGQAAMARGADRAGARRAAMLATGERGLTAAGTTAALAAQEQAQKQAAYTGALQGVRAGDVSIADAATRPAQLNQMADIQTGQLNTGNALQAARANQDAGLQASIQTGAQRINAGQSNQQYDLLAQKATVDNKQTAWKAGQDAQQGWGKLALEGVGAQNQAQGVAANYGSNQNLLRSQQAGGLLSMGASMLGLSDERAKREVERMGDADIADWAESVDTAVWRYKKGIPGTDDGEKYHTGALAGQLQSTGPLGKLMVHKRPDGLKEVEYGPLGLMVGKGALARANEALDWSKAAYALAAHGKGLVHG